MEKRFPVITVDGPSASGKGTISQILAQRLNWHMLDSGALYRLVALAALRQSVALNSEAEVAEIARQLDVEFVVRDESQDLDIVMDKKPVGDAIRTEKCGNAASKIAVLPQVRDALLERQRAFCQSPGLVADGRDMGTVVFPHADLKVFLTASAEERANRRYKQLKEKGINVNLPDLLLEVEQRDARDSSREVAPLKPATDAVIIDTSGMSIESVIQHLLEVCKQQELYS